MLTTVWPHYELHGVDALLCFHYSSGAEFPSSSEVTESWRCDGKGFFHELYSTLKIFRFHESFRINISPHFRFSVFLLILWTSLLMLIFYFIFFNYLIPIIHFCCRDSLNVQSRCNKSDYPIVKFAYQAAGFKNSAEWKPISLMNLPRIPLLY